MAQIKTTEDIKQLGTILGVWAHPDDETFTSAGILAAAIGNGQRVVCVTATKGEKGVQDEKRWPQKELAAIRTEELQSALRILGVKEHRWLQYGDGCCTDVSCQDAANEIFELIMEYKPDTMLTFGPEGSTGHPDHIAISEWVTTACAQMTQPPAIYHVADTIERYEDPFNRIDKSIDYYFNLKRPHLIPEAACDICFALTPELCQTKCAALATQISQTEKLFKDFTTQELQKAFSIEAFVRAI